MAGRQLANVFEGRRWFKNVTKVKILQEALRVSFLQFRRGGENHFDFRAENQAIASDRVMYGLDPQPVPGKQKCLFTFVEDGKRKHPPQLVDTIRAVLLVQMNYNFGIRVGVKTMAERFKLPPQSGKIINLAVEDDPDSSILVMHRLTPPPHVNDAKPAHPDSCKTVRINTFIVRATMHHSLTHTVNNPGVNGGSAFAICDSGNSAH